MASGAFRPVEGNHLSNQEGNRLANGQADGSIRRWPTTLCRSCHRHATDGLTGCNRMGMDEDDPGILSHKDGGRLIFCRPVRKSETDKLSIGPQALKTARAAL